MPHHVVDAADGRVSKGCKSSAREVEVECIAAGTAIHNLDGDAFAFVWHTVSAAAHMRIRKQPQGLHFAVNFLPQTGLLLGLWPL